MRRSFKSKCPAMRLKVQIPRNVEFPFYTHVCSLDFRACRIHSSSLLHISSLSPIHVLWQVFENVGQNRFLT